MIEQLDYFVRLIAIGASLMLIAQIADGAIRPGLRIALVGLLVGVIAYLINSSDALEPSGPVDQWLNLAALSPPFWSWLFGRRLFEREPPRRAVLIIVALLVAAWFAGDLVAPLAEPAFYAMHIVSLALIADLVRIALTERSDDLIEKRRVIRLVLPLLIAAQAGLILIYEMIVGMAVAVPWIQLANAVLIFVIMLFAGLALLRTDAELLVETEAGAAIETRLPAPDLSPSERVLHDKLIAAMDEGAYRTPGLTIARLAERLDTPEHRLRALINRRLGHRNFSAFLNRHRIAEARERLGASEHVDLPILTIAMDLGYNSLPPFNRAFRAETGTSPSEYRKRAFGENGSDEPPDAIGQN